MAEKPGSLPRWADSGGEIINPVSGKKDVGFLAGERPIAQMLNWLFNLIYLWIAYLNAPVGTGSGAGMSATGGSTSGAGFHGTGGAPNGIGLLGTGTGTGAGTHGVGTSGYGVVAESDTTSPAKAALRIVPQDAEPSSSPAAGDASVVGTKLRLHNGTAWDRAVVQSKASVSDSVSAVTTANTAFGEKYTIPANTLQVGSTIRVRAWGRVTATAGGGDYNTSIYIGGVSFLAMNDRTVGANEAFYLDVTVVVRSLGASAGVRGVGLTHAGPRLSATLDHFFKLIITDTIDTTAAVDVQVYYDLTNSSDQVTLDALVVDVN
jgi:hypothetical protein